MDAPSIHSRSGPWWPVALALVPAAGCWMLAIHEHSEAWFVGSTAPALVALALGLSAARPMVIRITEEGLDLVLSDETIPYESINALADQDHGGKRFRITLWVDHRPIDIPERIDVASRLLEDFLVSRLARGPVEPLDPAMAAFHAEQQAVFDDHQVEYFARRPRRMGADRQMLLVSLAVILAGLVWICYGASNMNLAGEFFLAGMLLAIAGAFALVPTLAGSGDPKFGVYSRSAEMILSPAGLALQQSDLKGGSAGTKSPRSAMCRRPRVSGRAGSSIAIFWCECRAPRFGFTTSTTGRFT